MGFKENLKFWFQYFSVSVLDYDPSLQKYMANCNIL